MDTDRFDNLLRSLSETPSRRGALRALGGLGLAGLFGHADAAAKKRKKKKKKKPASCVPTCTNGRTCQGGTCTCATQCCADGDCGAGRICAQGQCVTGQGTCATGADVCTGSAPCGGASSNCFCWTTTANQTRCGINSPLSACNTCANDATCAALFPNTPGVFCFKTTGGGNCPCGGRCMAPCAS